jgi:nitrite reductase (cytochrome c-552)
MWAGYAFATDFRKKRGHAYMLEDQTYTERVEKFKQPGTCIHCHGSVYVPYKKAGGGDLIKGFEHYNQMPYKDARKDFTHPIACIDCHDPATMALRVTRPGFLEGIKALKASQGVADYDVNAQATRQEMRSFVCGQCHVEYYFKGDEKRLTYPWAKGLRVDQIADYYDEVGFKDWTHALTGAPTLKAQHPEFEMWNQGIHARSGVACADCHMPYTRVGALKVSDHHVRSPLLNINNACQTCHKWPESELLARAETIQGRTVALRNRAMDALVELINDIEAAQKAGASAASLDAARGFQRRGQFYVDFVESENSNGPRSAGAGASGRRDRRLRKGRVALRPGGAASRGHGTLPPPPSWAWPLLALPWWPRSAGGFLGDTPAARASLRTMAASDASALDRWLESESNLAAVTAADPRVRDDVAAYAHSPGERGTTPRP